jgi:hypothetical protein
VAHIEQIAGTTLATGDFTQSSDLALDDPASIAEATFAVSLEPEGGSPTGAPSNVMFLGKPVESIPPPGQPDAHCKKSAPWGDAL